MAGRTKKIRKAARSNPATTTSLLGLAVVAIGTQLGWDLQTQAQVTAIALAAVPVVRGVISWVERWRGVPTDCCADNCEVGCCAPAEDELVDEE